MCESCLELVAGLPELIPRPILVGGVCFRIRNVACLAEWKLPEGRHAPFCSTPIRCPPIATYTYIALLSAFHFGTRVPINGSYHPGHESQSASRIAV